MKKVTALLLVVCVVCAAGAAFAQPKQEKRPDPRQFQQRYDYGCPGYYNGPCCYGRGQYSQPQPQQQPRQNNQPAPRQFDDRRGDFRGEKRERFAPDMPQEIRAKIVEIAKLRIDLDEALSSKPVNKAKALDIHAQIQKIEQEVEAWKFAAMIERIEKGEAPQGRRAPMPPRMPAPAPEKPEPAPEAETAPEK